MASIDTVDPDGQSFGPAAFVKELSAVSHGRLKVTVAGDYGNGRATAEESLIRSIAAGDLDGGWPSSRAFARAGLAGLKAIEAPMLITNYAAEKELAAEPAARQLLAPLRSSPVVGLGLTVGPLRRPFATSAPLLGLSDWRGVRFRTFNSPVQAQAVRDLGAEPVDVGPTWIDDVRTGTLGGGEYAIGLYEKSGLAPVARYVTGNVVLWPKVQVLTFSRKRFDELSDQQRAWIRQAAHNAVAASIRATYDDQSIADELCAQGVSFPHATKSQLAVLHNAIQPTISALADDPAEAPGLRIVSAIAARHPEPDTITESGCAADARDSPIGDIPATRSQLPSGTYRVQVSVTDLARHRATNTDGLTGIWTLVVRNSTYELSCRPLDLPGTDCGHEVQDAPLDLGDLRGSGDVAYFIYRADRLARVSGCRLPTSADLPDHCFPGQTYRMNWHIDGETLRFSNYRSESWPNGQYVLKPWRRIS
jgi:TRAP-type C4-dicarboxylate transport system substrate-binding protein